MSLRRTVLMSLRAFFVQPFAGPAPRLFEHSLTQFGAYDLGVSSIRSLSTCRLPLGICKAHFGGDQRQFSSSRPSLAAPAATPRRGSKEGSPSPTSPASSSSRKSPKRAAASKRGKPKFTNKFVEAAAAGADLIDIELIKNEDVNNHFNNFQQEDDHQTTIEYNDADISSTIPAAALVLQDDAHPIREHLISRAAWAVLLRLRSAGHEAYIVGGTVRDILLHQIPKDYDILTSAEPSQIEPLFPRAFVLGKSFPICHVHHHNEVIEVSSFSTNSDPSKIPLDVAAMMETTKRESGRKGSSTSSSRGRAGRKGQAEKKQNGSSAYISEDNDNDIEDIDGHLVLDTSNTSRVSKNSGPTWASARRDNAIKRDFRVNGLLYDPFSRILYDYCGGTADCTARILRTMGSPTHSFTQDPARILRAVRLAARAGLDIEKETSEAMLALAATTAKLPQGRLQMELAAMFTHGAALESTKLLWKYGLLDMLLPHHAVMLSKQHVSREEEGVVNSAKENFEDGDDENTSASASSVLFSLLAELDRTASSINPAEASVWVTAIVAPLVAHECQKEVERRAAAKLRKLRREEDDDEERSSSSSNEWYDEDEDATVNNNNDRSGSKGKGKTATNGGAAGNSVEKGKKSRKEENEEITIVASENYPHSSPEYLELYGKIVDKVLLRLLSKPDAKTQKYLARIAPFAVPVGSGGGVKKKKNNNDIYSSNDSAFTTNGGTISTNSTHATNGTSSSSTVPAVPVLACVLPRQAVEAARSFLKLEAELRGVEDIMSLLGPSEKRGGGGGGKKRSGAQQPRYLGRQKRGSRRKLGVNEYVLSLNEYLVLQLLRDPRVQWLQATHLALEEEEEEEE